MFVRLCATSLTSTPVKFAALVYNVLIKLPCLDYSAHDNPAPPNTILKTRGDLNDAITKRDFQQAHRLQRELQQLGDHSYSQRGISTELEAPLLSASAG